jgi:hypothetical protein
MHSELQIIIFGDHVSSAEKVPADSTGLQRSVISMKVLRGAELGKLLPLLEEESSEKLQLMLRGRLSEDC